MKKIAIGLTVLLLALLAAGCNTHGSTSASSTARQKSKQLQGQIYQSKNDIEFKNYNERQKIADSAATILWCTFFPPGVQGVGNGSTQGQAFTVPIAGKLTSSNKRPYQSNYYGSDSDGVYPYENPGPDHMYGSSSEYRYGFDPTRGIYYDFTDLSSFCTTEPTVWQSTKTRIVVQTDRTLSNLTNQAEAAIKAGDPKRALGLLKKAEGTQR